MCSYNNILTVFSIIFPSMTIRLLVFLFFSYHVTIISIICSIFFIFFRVCIPIDWQTQILILWAEQRLIRVAPAALQEEQESLLYQDKSTYPAEQRLLCFYFVLLYLLFWMPKQDWAACKLDLRTVGWHTTNLWGISSHGIKK